MVDLGSIILPILVLVIVGAALFLWFTRHKQKPKRVCPYCKMELEDFMDECVYCSGPVSTAAISRDDEVSEEGGDYEVTPARVAVSGGPSAGVYSAEDIPAELVDTEVDPAGEAGQPRKDKTQEVIDDLKSLLLDDNEQDEKILKQLQRTTILTQVPLLEVIQGKRKIKNVRLTKELVYIGQEQGCDVHISSKDVALRHAVIKTQGSRSMLFSLDDRNKVEVNGQRVSKKELSSGDVIRISDCSIVFRIEE